MVYVIYTEAFVTYSLFILMSIKKTGIYQFFLITIYVGFILSILNLDFLPA